eukprot:scaffold2990_cov119-Isochrysis_galbana.AAC.1
MPTPTPLPPPALPHTHPGLPCHTPSPRRRSSLPIANNQNGQRFGRAQPVSCDRHFVALRQVQNKNDRGEGAIRFSRVYRSGSKAGATDLPGGCCGCSQSCRLGDLVARREGATQLSTCPCEVPAGCSDPGARVQQLGLSRTKHPCSQLVRVTVHFSFAVRPRSKYNVPSAATASGPHGRSAMGRADMYLRPEGADSASQRSAESYSRHSSEDGAVLGRFPKPAAIFRTPAATPSLEPDLVNLLLAPASRL